MELDETSERGAESPLLAPQSAAALHESEMDKPRMHNSIGHGPEVGRLRGLILNLLSPIFNPYLQRAQIL